VLAIRAYLPTMLWSAIGVK